MSRTARPTPTLRHGPRLGVCFLALLLLSPGCSKEEHVTAVDAPPRIGALQTADTAEDDPRYPRHLLAGSRLVRLDKQGPDGAMLVITPGFATAGEARLTHDGEALLFLGKQRSTDPQAIYACDLEGEDLRQLAPAPRAQGPATRLPDGRIVFSARPQAGRPAALYVAAGDGSPGLRITFSGQSETNPTLLKDGRILYVVRHPSASGLQPALFTVFPDGTGASLFHVPAKHAAIRSLCQAADGDVYFVAEGRLRRIDWRRPRAAATTPELPDGVLALRVEVGTGGSLLVTARAPGGATDVLRLSPEGSIAALLVPALEGRHLVHVLEAVARRRPQGHLSRVDPTRTYGTWLGMEMTAGGAEAVRILAQVRASSISPPFAVLGVAPLHPDGSFYVRVPVDTPLRIELLDGNGGVLRASQTPYWVRPNEVRGCTGCHDPENRTPPNASPRAAAEAPVNLCPPRRAEEPQ